jgi:hypothetical protein
LLLLQFAHVSVQAQLESNMTTRRDFLNMPAPENYVAGLGRGATGFTTRSDLGPAREGPSEDQIKEALAKRAAALGFGDVAGGKKDDDENDDADRYQDPDNEVGLFAGGVYDKDDDEADRIYREVDEKMDRRRKIRRLVHPFPIATLLSSSQHFLIPNSALHFLCIAPHLLPTIGSPFVPR